VIRLDVTIPAGADATVLLPTEAQMTEVEIREGDHVVWQNGNYLAGDPGVTGANLAYPPFNVSGISIIIKGIEINVTSGSYSFVLKGE
jgi:hypothetical protein